MFYSSLWRTDVFYVNVGTCIIVILSLGTRFMFVVLTQSQYYLYDQIRVDEMGEACGTHGGEEKCPKGFGGEI